MPYRLGAESTGDQWPPKALDCSELVELCFSRNGVSCPDGSWNQHAASRSVEATRPGDLGFFAKLEKIRPGNPRGVYHVGVLFSKNTIIEARAKDSKGRYGEVILRPRSAWEAYKPFKEAGGWRRLAVLME